MAQFFTEMIFLFMMLTSMLRYGTALQVDIADNTALLHTEVTVSCETNMTHEVITIQVAKENQSPIVILRQSSDMIFGDAFKRNFKAEGQISKQDKPDYLRLTLINPGLDDIGLYVCSIFFMNDEGELLDAKASAPITIDNLGVLGLVETMRKDMTVLENTVAGNKLKIKKQSKAIIELQNEIQNKNTKFTHMKHEIDQQNTTFSDFRHQLEKTFESQQGQVMAYSSKVRRLEVASKQQKQSIQELKEKGKVCAFTAFYNNEDKFSKGSVLLFGNVLVNLCNAYNSATGVFTAPQSGLYVFSLTITTVDKGDEVIVKIYAKDQDVGKVFVRDDDAWGDQSSFTLLLQLSKGDKVYPKVSDSSTNSLESYDYYSVFSAYLVHALL